jgi:hypothetical protein
LTGQLIASFFIFSIDSPLALARPSKAFCIRSLWTAPDRIALARMPVLAELDEKRLRETEDAHLLAEYAERLAYPNLPATEGIWIITPV